MNTTPDTLEKIDCFLLTTAWRDYHNRFEITLHAVTPDGKPVVIVIDTFRPLFFVSRTTPHSLTVNCAERKQVPLVSLEHTQHTVDCLYFSTYSSLRQTAWKLRSSGWRTFESDVGPVERFCMERFIKGGFSLQGKPVRTTPYYVFRNPRLRGAEVTPSFRVLALACDLHPQTGALRAIAFSGVCTGMLRCGGQASERGCDIVSDETSLLKRFFECLHTADPDILIGWHIMESTLRILCSRSRTLNVSLPIGRSRQEIQEVPTGSENTWSCIVPGRVVLDLPALLKSFHHGFEDYSLDSIAKVLLGEQSQPVPLSTKVDHMKRIFQKTTLLDNVVARSKLSGHTLDRTGGSIAAFDFLYLPLLHRKGFVARDVADNNEPEKHLQGGYVLEPQPGLYDNVLVLDFKSLYPTIITTFMIDPLGVVEARAGSSTVTGPAGIPFSRTHSILPGIITELLSARSRAKQEKNLPLSTAIKILMNSFYGVLGARSCRFFRADLAEAITSTGRFILKHTIELIQNITGRTVLYGDTDSLFVLLGDSENESATSTGRDIASDTTQRLAEELHKRFGVRSFLELEFECFFDRFFIPPLRHGMQGSKKRYCGCVKKDNDVSLFFKGLESARTDWTELAKEFQHHLYRRLFLDLPVDEYIVSTVAAVKRGSLDDKLIYRKRLRKQRHEYTAQIPPHVQAARMLDKPVQRVSYYITTDGPQPAEQRSSALDYEHYISCQLSPIADAILWIHGTSFDRVVSGQQDLFASLDSGKIAGDEGVPQS